MASVTRRTYFGLKDGTGDYLIIAVALAAPDGRVELDEIIKVEHIDWETRYRSEWALDGADFAQVRDKATAFIERFFAGDGAEIAMELAENGPTAEER